MKKSYFIMLMALMCMFSCRTENTSDILSDQTHKSKFDASFKEVLQATKSPDESSLMAKVQDFTEDYNPSDFIMDTAKIKKTLKNGEVTEYAIYLKKKNETEIGVFYNLVFTKKIDSWKKYLVKFTPAIIPETNNKVGYKCEFISKKAQASKCGSSFYMTEYFQCWAGHTDSNDGDCNGCWRLGSYGIANTCDEEAPDDFNGAGDNYGGGATPNVDGLIHLYADPSHWALYNSLSAENKFKCYQALLLSSDTSYVNFSIDFFSSNPKTTIQQFQKWFINGQLNYQNSSDVEFAGNLSALSHDLLIANQNNTLNQLQANWPNWEKIKQNIKNSIAQGVHQTAKIVKTYYDEVSGNPYTNNAATRVVLNLYIDALRNEIKQTTNMNKDTMNWQDLFNIWLFELMPNPYSSINFTWNSNVINGSNLYNANTNAVYKFPKGSPDMMNEIKNGLSNGTFNVGNSMSRYFWYNFTQYYATLSNNNVGIQMLGSYNTKATVISKSGNSAVVRFYIFNTLGWDSGTRFVQTADGTVGIIPNKEIGEGIHLGGNLDNTYTWEEIIVF